MTGMFKGEKYLFPRSLIQMLFNEEEQQVWANRFYDRDIFLNNLNYMFEQNKDVFNEREETIFKRRYVNGETLKAIANDFNISIDRVRQIAFRTLNNIRRGDRKKLLMYGAKANELNKSIEESIKLDVPLEKQNKVGNIKIEELNLSVRAFNCLIRARIYTLKDFYIFTDKLNNIDNLMKVRNLGRRAYNEVIATIEPYFKILILETRKDKIEGKKVQLEEQIEMLKIELETLQQELEKMKLGE